MGWFLEYFWGIKEEKKERKVLDERKRENFGRVLGNVVLTT
jgi:hypothetical protein